jgi:hypothetical protein
MRLPTKKSIRELISRIKRIMLENPDMYWDVETEQYECQLTVGVDGQSQEFGYQTGDNSFSGACYSYPHWAIVTITNYSNVKELTDEIINQFHDLISQ